MEVNYREYLHSFARNLNKEILTYRLFTYTQVSHGFNGENDNAKLEYTLKNQKDDKSRKDKYRTKG